MRINIEQGSFQWHEFRRYHVMATCSSCILGLNPHKTALDLFNEKVQGVFLPDNDHMRRGRLNEPLARAAFIEQAGIEVAPAVIRSDEWPFMAASLDGICSSGNTIIEIKSPARIQTHLSQTIPQHYACQMQHQLAVTRAKCCFFVSYHEDDPNKIIIQEILPDLEFIEIMIEKEREFYEINMCQGKEPEPPWTLKLKETTNE